MVRLRDQHPLLLGFPSPQDEDHPRLLRCHQFDHAIGEQLPAASLMRIGLARPDREDRVEHEDTLSGPGFQIPVIGDPASNIFMEFPIDVSQREGQRPNGRLHGEAEAMRMTRGWIGILADKQHADLVLRCCGQCVEDVLAGRQDRLPTGEFFFKKGIERAVIGLARLIFEQRSPAWRNGRQHRGN